MSHLQARSIVDDYFESSFDSHGRRWKIVRDGSVPKGFELVTPPIYYSDLSTLRDLYRRFRRQGANPSEHCSTHVHVDAHMLGPMQIAHLLTIYARQARLLRRMMRLSDARQLLYAQPIDGFVEKINGLHIADLSDLMAHWHEWSGSPKPRSGKLDPSRYHEINLHSLVHQGTVEFRGMASTRSAMRLSAFATLVLSLASHCALCNSKTCPLMLESSEQMLLHYLGLDRHEYNIVHRELLRALRESSETDRQYGPHLAVVTREGHMVSGRGSRAVVTELVECGFLESDLGRRVMMALRPGSKKPRTHPMNIHASIIHHLWSLGEAEVTVDGVLAERSATLGESLGR